MGSSRLEERGLLDLAAYCCAGFAEACGMWHAYVLQAVGRSTRRKRRQQAEVHEWVANLCAVSTLQMQVPVLGVTCPNKWDAQWDAACPCLRRRHSRSKQAALAREAAHIACCAAHHHHHHHRNACCRAPWIAPTPQAKATHVGRVVGRVEGTACAFMHVSVTRRFVVVRGER